MHAHRVLLVAGKIVDGSREEGTGKFSACRLSQLVQNAA